MGLHPDELTMIHIKDQTERQVLELLRDHPEAMSKAGNLLLGRALQEYTSCDCLTHEFMYHLTWLACQRVDDLLKDHEKVNEQINHAYDDEGNDDDDYDAITIHG